MFPIRDFISQIVIYVWHIAYMKQNLGSILEALPTAVAVVTQSRVRFPPGVDFLTTYQERLDFTFTVFLFSSLSGNWTWTINQHEKKSLGRFGILYEVNFRHDSERTFFDYLPVVSYR